MTIFVEWENARPDRGSNPRPQDKDREATPPVTKTSEIYFTLATDKSQITPVKE